MGTSLHARPRCSLPAHNQRSRHLGLPTRPCAAAQHQRLALHPATLLPQVNLQAPRGPLVVAAAVASSPLPGTPSTSGSSSSSSSSYQFGDYGAELSWRQNIASKYVMGHAVGQGSFGTAYLAISLETGRDCCVKQLIKQRAKLSRERTLEKLCREVEILERLQGCPAVVKLVDLFEDESYVYIVTELCSGGDLQKLSDSLGPFNERGVALVAQEVLKVVHACHEAGILHGDVKPANFVLQHKSRTPLSSADPKLRQAPWLKAIDFGCSQVFANGSEARRLSKRTGTPVYMAPEIFARDYSVEADMWSTGVMLYQLFSRQFPFWDTSSTCRATNLEEIAEAVTNAEIKFDYGPWLEMSEEGLDFVKRCLVRDPTKRMTVAEAMAHPWFGTMLHHLDEKVYANVSNNIVPSPMAARREATAPAAAGVPAPAA